MFGKNSNSPEKKLDPTLLKSLANSGEAQQLMSLLQENGAVKEAAQSAAKGDSTALLSMVQNMMKSKEGADLIEKIQQKAKDAGVE